MGPPPAAFGIRLTIRFAGDIALEVRREICLATGAVETDDPAHITVARRGGTYRAAMESTEAVAPDVASLVLQLRRHVDQFVAEHSPTHVFVHAGVVGVGDRAVLVTGASFAGKSTAVEALVRRGAAYYSDEYAPVDDAGLVAAYPRPLNRRSPDGVERVHLGEGGPPLPIGVVVFARYRHGSSWRPTLLAPGTGLLRLIENAVGARTDPERVLRTLAEATEGVRLLDGDRGEADAFADAILSSLH